jgi:hypothetical protein
MTAFPNTDEIVINPDYSFWKAFDIIVGKVSSTYLAVSGDTGESRSSGSNDDPVIQYAIDTLSAAGGGSVGVRAAAYSASVVLKNGVRLVIEKGATGITVSVNAGATCWLEDYNGAVKYFYLAGSLVWKEDLVTGELWWRGENRTDTLAYPEQTASYIVFQDGSLTKMKNGTTGQVDASSTNASRIMNWALGNLSGTYQETVYLKGNFTVDTPLTPNDYTVLDGNGIITLADSSDCHVIQVYSKSHVTIRNLKIDANENGQTGGNFYCGVYVEYSNDCLVENCYIANATRYGIVFTCYGDDGHASADHNKGCSDCKAINNFVTGSCWNGICIAYSTGCLATQNTLTDSSDYGISTWEATNCKIVHNHAYDNNKMEGAVPNQGEHHDIGVEHNSTHIWVESNTCESSKIGVSVDTDSTNTTVRGNLINNELLYGVYCGTTIKVTVDGNEIYGVANGINVQSTCSEVSIINNVVGGTSDHAILITASGTWVSNNKIDVDVDKYGVEVDYCDGVNVVANTITGYNGIRFYTSSNSSAMANAIVASAYGIVVSTDADWNFISNNNLKAGNKGLAILHDTCNSTIVDGNNFRGSVDDVWDAGTGTIWGSNFDINGVYDQGIEP